MGTLPKIYTPKATNTLVERDIRDRFADIVNIKDYGAIGDSFHDDTNAWNYFKNVNSGVKYIPSGTYRINDNIFSYPEGRILGYLKECNIVTHDQITSLFAPSWTYVVNDTQNSNEMLPPNDCISNYNSGYSYNCNCNCNCSNSGIPESSSTVASHTHGNIANDGKLSTANRVMITDNNKVVTTSTITSTELSYLSGVTNNIQNQITNLQTQIANSVDDTNVVHLTRNENISGAKTFAQGPYGTSSIIINSDIDLASGCVFTKTISADTTFTITGVPTGKAATFNLILTNGGAFTIAWPANMKWTDDTAPDLTASGIDVLTFVTPNGGTTWYGTVAISGVAE